MNFKMSIFALLLVSGVAAQSVPQRKGIVFGTFSSLHYLSETGDVVGMELLVMPNMSSAYVVLQCAEGAPGEPVLVPAKVSGTKIEFTVKQQGGDCNGEYRGDANIKGMIVKRSSASHPEFLLRKKSYWAQ